MKVLLTGAGGMLAGALQQTTHSHGHELIALDRNQLDVRDPRAVEQVIRVNRPDVIVQCAGYTRVDDAEAEEDVAFAVNALGARHVARSAAAIGAWFVYPSTDYVFDGTATRPYLPQDPPAPLNAYGRSKLAGEHEARAAGKHLIVRTSWLYGAGGRNFVTTILQHARAGTALRVVDDQRGSPTWTRDLAETMLLLLEREADAGVYHACNAGAVTWHGLAEAAVQLSGNEVEVTPVPSAEFPRPAKRPAYSVLDCTSTERVVGPMRAWRAALEAALHEEL